MPIGDDERHITRRRILGAGVAAAALGGAAAPQVSGAWALAPPGEANVGPAALGPTVPLRRSGEYLHAAEEAARWIRSAQRQKETGVAWLPDPDHPDKAVTVGPDNTIYSGSAGVVLFLLELARTTGKSSYQEDALRGADYLAASWARLPDGPSPAFLPDRGLSFDQGLAGVAFTLSEGSPRTNPPIGMPRSLQRVGSPTPRNPRMQACSGSRHLLWGSAAGSFSICYTPRARSTTTRCASLRHAAASAFCSSPSGTRAAGSDGKV